MPGDEDGSNGQNQRYHVKRASGKVFGPFDKNAIKMMLKAGKIGPEAAISVDKEDWKPVSMMPAFADMVDGLSGGGDNANKTMMGGFAAATGGGDDSEDQEDLPTRKMRGDEPGLQDAMVSGTTPDDDLPKPKLGPTSEAEAADDPDPPTAKLDAGDQEDSPGLSRPKSKGGSEEEGGPSLPRPKSSGDSVDEEPGLPRPKSSGDDGPGLPRPKSSSDSKSDDGPGLPRPKSSGQQQEDDEPGLPRPKSSGGDGPPDLPTPKSKSSGGGADLPRSAESDAELPQTKATDDLPRSARENLPADGEGGLPRSQEDNLPADGEGGLPRSQEDNLPADGEGGLPRSQQDNLPGDGQGGLPRSQQDNLPGDGQGGLPRSQQDNLPGDGPPPSPDEPSDDDLFAEEEDDDLFGEPEQDDDLFADSEAGGADEADDDLFAADEPDEDDDLFAESETDDDDLFDEGSGSTDDDLFAEDDEDDLFGSPEEPEQEDEDIFGAGDDDDDIFGGEEPQLADKQVGPDTSGDEIELGGDQPVGGPGGAGGSPGGPGGSSGQIPSGGPPPGDDGGESLELDDAAIPEPDRGGDAYQPQSSGLPGEESSEAQDAEEAARRQEDGGSSGKLVAAAALILLVGGGAAFYFFYLKGPTETQDKTTNKAPQNVTVDLSNVPKGTHDKLKGALASVGEGSLSQAERGKLLFVQSLYLSHYDDAKLSNKASKHAKKLEEANGGFAALGRGSWAAQRGKLGVAKAYLEPLYEAKQNNLAYFARLATGIGHVRSLKGEIDSDTAQPKPTRGAEAIPTTAQGRSEEGGEASETGEPAGDEEAKGSADAGGADTDAGEPQKEESPADEALQQKIAAGVDILTTARKNGPKVGAPDFWLGRLYETSGTPDKALDHYKKATDIQPDHVPSHLRAARLTYEQGDLEQSMNHTDTILSEMGAVAGQMETAEAYHLTGLVQVARSQSTVAIESFTKALAKDSGRSETLRELAKAYERAGKYQESLNFFKSNESLGEDNPEVLLGIVRAHMGLEQWQNAINVLENGEKKFPQDARFPYFLGKLHLKRGAFTDAKNAMKRAVGIDAKLLEAYGTLAQLTWRLDQDPTQSEYYVQQIVDHPRLIDGDVATKVAGYYRMSDRPTLARKWYKEALKRDPNAWEARLSLARLLLQEEETTKALELLEKAREAGVEDIRLSAYLGDAYRQSEQYDRALQEIDKVIEKNPENAEYIFIRGQIHFDRGNLDTARRDFNKAAELDPLFYKASFYVGRTAFEQGDFKKAMKIFRQVLDDQSEEGEYRYWMGRALEKQGRLKDALTEYRNATKFDKEYGRENPTLYVRRGRLMSKLGYPQKGKEETEKAIEIDPDMAEAYLAMGEADFQAKKYRSAIDNFRQALDRREKAPIAHYKMGMSLIYSEKKREGAQHLQKAVEYGYEDPEVYQTLGYLYKELGKSQLAVESFKQFLRETAEDDLPKATRREMIRQIQELGG